MPLPSPEKRPDLYDDFDYLNRPEGWVNPIPTSPRIQKHIDECAKRRAAGRALREAAE